MHIAFDNDLFGKLKVLSHDIQGVMYIIRDIYFSSPPLFSPHPLFCL